MHLTTYLPSSLLTKDYLGRQIALVILNKGYNLRCILPHQISFQVAISKKFKNITHSNILNVIYPPRFSCKAKVYISFVSPQQRMWYKDWGSWARSKVAFTHQRITNCRGSSYFLLPTKPNPYHTGLIQMCKADYQIKSLPPLPVNHLPVIVQPLFSKVDQARKKHSSTSK